MSSIFRRCAVSIFAGAALCALLSTAPAGAGGEHARRGFAAVFSRHFPTSRALAAADPNTPARLGVPTYVQAWAEFDDGCLYHTVTAQFGQARGRT
jgi:hypothetical protein